MLERTRALPGVTSAGFVTNPPLTFQGGKFLILGEGQPPPQPGEYERYIMSVRTVSAGYLETLGVPLIRGRGFDSRDSAEAAPTAVINEAMARMRWPGEDPVGRRFRFAFPNAPWMTVVGVVGDMKQMGLDTAPFPELYTPTEQTSTASFMWPRYLVVRTKDDPLSLAAAVREVVRQVDPDQPVGVQAMSDVFDAAVGNRTTQLTLVGGFAVLGLLLASIGLFGVLSYTVARRTSEIGLRMALGAQRATVVGSVVRARCSPRSSGSRWVWSDLGALSLAWRRRCSVYSRDGPRDARAPFRRSCSSSRCSQATCPRAGGRRRPGVRTAHGVTHSRWPHANTQARQRRSRSLGHRFRLHGDELGYGPATEHAKTASS